VIYEEIAKLTAAERIRLAQEILESVASEIVAPPLTEEQRAELRARLTDYRANPDASTVTLPEIRAKLGLA
jgi:putative addiction module component (TIGR02574 family)